MCSEAAQERLELRAMVQREAESREDRDAEIIQLLGRETELREQEQLRESKAREDTDAAMRKDFLQAIRKENEMREERERATDRPLELASRERTQERDERQRADRELAGGLAKAASKMKQEEAITSKTEQQDREKSKKKEKESKGEATSRRRAE